ncbi:MAG: MFS transporter [Bacteroidales bacterium]|nr:MFS transporter [Bacteroidales bacterium]
MKKFLPLYITNIFGVMNDNLLKTLVCFIGVAWVSDEYQSLVVNATAGALVLPYLFFSPLAGRLPQFFSKLRIFRAAKLMELPIMFVAIAGFYFHNIWLALSAVLLMGLQSALYSPAKYGLIKDIGGVEGVSKGMGGMEAVAFFGMLLGTVVASFMAEMSDAYYYYFLLLLLAVMGAVSSFSIRANEQKADTDTSANPYVFLRDTAKLVGQHKGLHHVIHLLSLFWWLSASLQIVLILYCNEALGMSPSETGYLLALTAIGITAGCLVGGYLDHRYFMIGYVPLLGIIDALLLLVAFAAPLSPVGFAVVIALVAFVGGLFKIPLDAEIQKRVPSQKLNVVLAYFNLVSFIYIFMASATNMLVTSFLPTGYVFLVLAIVIGFSSLLFLFDNKEAICCFGRSFMHLHYDVKLIGRDTLDLPEGDNMLVLPMHRAVIDPLMLFAELYDKKLQPLVDEGYFKFPFFGHVLGLFDAVEVPDLRLSRRGLDQVRKLDSIVVDGLNRGDNILFYPSGHITTDGHETIGARHLAYSICGSLPEKTHVVAVRIRGLWGSEWSRYRLNATPSLLRLLLKSLGLIMTGAIFFMKKRVVEIEFVDITAQTKSWSQLSKLEFNRSLEAFYEECLTDELK